ncbi:MAG: LysR family transcriptional regulator [Clostridium sp.]|nr:MAG: LysR family transcriptional regulator [Clostridium sp.]
MNLKQLSYFVTVVESGSISKAAKKLHMSQPPLSRHMHLLEEDLRVKLFQREINSLKLTQEGEELYKRAYDLLELAAKKLKKAILELNKKMNIKTLEIGMVSSSINYLLDKPIYDYLNKKS